MHLLPNKITATYSRMFKVIKEADLRNCLVFSPNTLKIDFEIGIIVTISETVGYETIIKWRLLLCFIPLWSSNLEKNSNLLWSVSVRWP